uniref:Uncharacterized protein ycf33 n=1 Tax=Trieres chinensis TaxID=1514140 RepID=YCF33_TRICV|nr:ORF64 [Trieres chinensis]YP_010537330.1 hypothetical protein ON826_pgp131 [Odontella regia]P49532.1 RecName: Full=Uncharacterized protein ycf33 [Trieres chinensis]UYC31117.1 hypothetical protein [Odontella regia]CAA91682.1 ORF64 [Trieres chinensis]
MNDFWTNVFRYPRFFISSLIGLLLVILSPFKNLFKIAKLRIFVILFILLFFLGIYFVLVNMTGL